MTFVMAWPLAATIDRMCVEGALWYWLKPMQLFLQICLSAAGSTWFSPSDTKLARMTFSWGEFWVGRICCFALASAMDLPAWMCCTPFTWCRATWELTESTSSSTSFRASWSVWKAVMCWCKWLALGQACYSGQTHHAAAVWILAGPGFAAEGSHQLIGPCSSLRIICQTNIISCNYTQPPWKKDGGWGGCGCGMNILEFSGQK